MRKVIVVIGMHRSGTSMVSGILKLAGLDLGENLWAPDHSNAKGYFENSQIGIFNDHLFELLYTNWHNTLFLPDQWWLDGRISAEMDRLAVIVNEQFGSTSFMLIKDPRICVLLPFYLRFFEKMNIKPYFIINYRDPYEVSTSLKKRNNLPFAKGLILWMDHNLKAELYTRRFQRIFMRYDQVIVDPLLFLDKINDQFALSIEITPVQKELIQTFVEKELKHHYGQFVSNEGTVPAHINNLYRLIQTVNGIGTNRELMEKFDIIRMAFYSEYRFYHGIDNTFEALIQFEMNSGIREKATLPIQHGYNHLVFNITSGIPVSKIILNPCNQMTGVIIHKVLITNTLNEQSEILPKYSNADWNDLDGSLVFESETPEITFILDFAQIITDISIEMTYFVMGINTFRYGIHKRNLITQKYLSKS